MAVDMNALPPVASTAPAPGAPLPTPTPAVENQVHIALTYAAIALFASLTLLFNIDWIVLKQAAAQTQALALDAVVLAALPLQAVKLPNFGG